MSPLPPSLPGRLSLWREHLRESGGARTRVIGALASLGLLSGLCETLVVVAVVALATQRQDALPLIGDTGLSTTELAGLALAAVAVLAATHLVSARVTARVAASAQRAIQAQLVGAYLRAPWDRQARVKTGELQDLVSTKAFDVAVGAQQAASAVALALNLLVVAIAAFVLSPWATLVLAVALAGVLAVGLLRRRQVRRHANAVVDVSTDLATEVTETALAARELRIFGVTGAAQARVEQRVDEAAGLIEGWLRRTLAGPPLMRDASIALLIVALAVVVGSLDVSVAALGATTILILRALGHAQGLAGSMHAMAERRASQDRVRERLADWAPARAHGRRPCPAVAEVALADVSHTYEGTVAPALAGVDLRVRRGEMVGVIGRTGAGKSTLAAVLLGLLVPDRGGVLVDGVPLEDIDPAEWHRRTAWVPQDPRLLTGTVGENVRFLRDRVTGEAVAAALDAAGLGAEVAAWEHGAGHDAGPAGASLSGGERQRLALARALAGDPDVLVLDEPTSALDAHTEAAVREALETARERTAIVVIAHRLSTIRSCDRVAVLDEGRLVAVAPPAELEATNDWFREALAMARAPGALP